MINEYLNYLQESIRIDSRILNIRATSLPSDILKFAQTWRIIRYNILMKRKGTATIPGVSDIPPTKISNSELDKYHKLSCDEIIFYYNHYKNPENIKLINDKLLYNFYEGSNYRTWGITWYSFKDKKIYTCHDADDSNIFFESHKPPFKFIFKPIPFKEWFKKWTSDKNNHDRLDYSWLR